MLVSYELVRTSPSHGDLKPIPATKPAATLVSARNAGKTHAGKNSGDTSREKRRRLREQEQNNTNNCDHRPASNKLQSSG